MSLKSVGSKQGKFSKEVKEAVVKEIMAGRLLINEAMDQYGILAAVTIKKWVIEAKEQEREE